MKGTPPLPLQREEPSATPEEQNKIGGVRNLHNGSLEHLSEGTNHPTIDLAASGAKE
jgi:hypothetical protein